VAVHRGEPLVQISALRFGMMFAARNFAVPVALFGPILPFTARYIESG
jgi:hypothetical protein